MRLNDIKRPKLVQLSEEGMRIEISAPHDIHDNETKELVDILVAPTLILANEKGEDGKFPLPIDPKMFDNETYRRFNSFTYSLGKMVRLAEMNLDTLISIVGAYIHIVPVEEILKRNADCQKLAEYDIEKNFERLTFGNLRNILSCLIKTDRELHQIAGLTTTQERKNFTSVYRNYIEDRDCYTHGILFFLYPSMEPILRVKTNKGNNVYVKYERDVFKHNLQTYNYLTKILNDIREYLQKKMNNQ